MAGNKPNPLLSDLPPLSEAKRKFYARLREKKIRDAETLFVAEGERTVFQLLQALVRPPFDKQDSRNFPLVSKHDTYPQLRTMLIGEAFPAERLQMESLGIDLRGKCLRASAAQLISICDTEQPQGIVGIFEQPPTNFTESLVDSFSAAPSLVLVLDGVQDPGNVGTIIRTAAWFGASAVIANAGTADFFNPKTVRSTAGSLFALSLVHSRAFESDLTRLKISGYTLYAADLDGTDVRRLSPAPKSALLIGNEANGISKAALALADERLFITGNSAAVESLNAAVSAGILCAALAPR